MSLRRQQFVGTGAALIAAASLFAALPAAAQYPGQVSTVNKSAPQLRSVVVVEWTGGDLAHAKASRVIPISVWDGQQLQDGGIYLAQPEPLALQGEVEYELEKDGRNVGFFDIHSAAQQQDSWIGFGTWKPLPTGPTPQQLAQSARQKVDVDDDENSDEPILHRGGDAARESGNSGSTAQASAPDSDRPVLHSGGDAAGGSGSNNSSANGPTLHRSGDAGGDNSANGTNSNGPTLQRGGDAAGDASASGSNPNGPTLHRSGSSTQDDNTASNEPPPDPDRPRLHADDDSTAKPAAAPVQPNPGNDVAYVSDLPNIADPDRPRLVPGRPASYGPPVKPTLMGLPAEMQQEVGVSDVRQIPNHPWDYTWANPGDEMKMKAAMEEMARKALGLEPPPAAPAPKRSSVRHKTTPPPAPAPPAPLEDEQFRVFELQYGAGATMVLSAHTKGTGADLKFVTLVAQPDLYGGAVALLKNVTDDAHLDVTPRMRLIDAVDALGDNRGELLFELRGQSQRQFTLYRVLRGQATQIFTTGAMFFGQAMNQPGNR